MNNFLEAISFFEIGGFRGKGETVRERYAVVAYLPGGEGKALVKFVKRGFLEEEDNFWCIIPKVNNPEDTIVNWIGKFGHDVQRDEKLEDGWYLRTIKRNEIPELERSPDTSGICPKCHGPMYLDTSEPAIAGGEVYIYCENCDR